MKSAWDGLKLESVALTSARSKFVEDLNELAKVVKDALKDYTKEKSDVLSFSFLILALFSWSQIDAGAQ